MKGLATGAVCVVALTALSLGGCGRLGFSELIDATVGDAGQTALDGSSAEDAGSVGDASDISRDTGGGGAEVGPRDLGGNMGRDAGGTRPPTVLVAQTLGIVTALAADDTHLYWATSGRIFRIDKTTRTGPSTIVVGVTASSLAVDATHVYWTNFIFEEVARAPKTGGEEEILAELNASPQEVIVDDQHAYWTTTGDSDVLQRVVKQGGAAPELMSQVGLPDDIAFGAEYVYWTSRSGGSRLQRVHKTTKVIDDLAAVGPVGDMAVAGDFVYYATPTSISRISIIGANTFTLASAQPNIVEFALADSFIAWASLSANNDIRRIPIGGGSVEILETGVSGPVQLLADGDSLYWADEDQIKAIDF